MRVSPPITWFGGKSRLCKQIVSHFPPHHTFVDVFGGSGAVLLAKRPAPVEVYNDINRKLVALFSVLKSPELKKKLVHGLEHTPCSRAEFEHAKKQVNEESDPVEMARLFFIVQRQSHGGLGQHWSYSVADTACGYSSSVRKFHAGIERLEKVHHRLKRVQIENLEWEDLIGRYDRKDTLFYLDPTYPIETRVNGGYEHELTLEDHERIVETLLTLQGKGVLSCYRHDVYCPLENAGWRRVSIPTHAQTSRHRSKRIESLYISPSALRARVTLDTDGKEATERMRMGAYHTHRVRTDRTEALILQEIASLQRVKKNPTKAAVARNLSLSREYVSRRYGHLFP